MTRKYNDAAFKVVQIVRTKSTEAEDEDIEKEDLMAVITISRQFGAGGKTLGKMIADELGYVFADDDITQKIAEVARVSPHWVDSVEREAGTKLSKVISKMVSKGLVDKVLKDERGYIDEQLYLDYLIVIIAQIGEEGNAVILGRGSQYILNDHPEARHVLLVNEFEDRVKFMEENYDLSSNKATQIVKNEDKRRLNLYRKIGKKDYDNPALYHLVLNMGRMDMKMAFKMVLDLVDQ
ncbi:cytidylate kinase-like family protein [Desulfococcaceae bacterium HSG8]|nr:cytidylate kinase-like family protein [Desulfococcaceae bacterium HSG8]